MVSVKDLIKKEDAQDATLYIQKCAKLGAPWIQWDPMWERYEVMVMQKSHSDIFARAWRLKCQRVEESPAVITAGAAPRARAAPQAPPTSAKAVITANQKPRPGTRNMEGDDVGGGGKAAKKQIKVLGEQDQGELQVGGVVGGHVAECHRAQCSMAVGQQRAHAATAP